MGELKDRYIRFDWAIKRMLRDKANFAVLEGLLTVPVSYTHLSASLATVAAFKAV